MLLLLPAAAVLVRPTRIQEEEEGGGGGEFFSFLFCISLLFLTLEKQNAFFFLSFSF